MQTRRKFISNISKAAVILNFPMIDAAKSAKIDNPYEGVDWKTVLPIPSTSHIHIGSQSKLDKVYNQFGLRHVPISNYYPSAPYYPARSIRENQFRVGQDFAIVKGGDFSRSGNQRWQDAKLQKGRFDWNKIIMGDPKWLNSLEEEEKKQLPFKLGEKVFTHVPSDLIISPNAEHHGFTNSSLHANGVGSLYSSGTFDAHSRFKTLEHGYFYGTGLPWDRAFKEMLDQLLFKDGGGVTINHPVWSSLDFNEVCRMLDFDKRVLGIEIFNDTCATGYGDPGKGWALKMWDEVLSSNRRCLGFFVPDHMLGRGRNVLLVPKFTEHECLKAYRSGAFWGAINGTGLAFTKIVLSGNKLVVEVNKESQLIIITNKGVDKKTYGKEIAFDIPADQRIKFVRVEAVDEISEQIFSQPIRFL